MANKITCKFCAAEFDEMAAKCPYCGSTNYKGAEAEYFEKLEDVRDNMEELEDVPEEEAKKEFRKQGKFLKTIFIVLGVLIAIYIGLSIWTDYSIKRDEKTNFLWRQQNIPAMNELYDQGKYSEMLDIFKGYYEVEDVYILDWEHYDFCALYYYLLNTDETLPWDISDEGLSKVGYTGVFFDEWQMMEVLLNHLDENEREVLKEYEDIVRKDLEERFQMSEEDVQAFYNKIQENDGFVSYSMCEEYVDEWYQEEE